MKAWATNVYCTYSDDPYLKQARERERKDGGEKKVKSKVKREEVEREIIVRRNGYEGGV